MKLKLFLSFLLFFVTASPQNSINLIVFPQLTNIDFVSLIPSNELQNNVRVFCVEITPYGIPVTIKGDFEWRKAGANDFLELGEFETKPFNSQNFCNEQLGSTEIPIKSFNSNNDLLNENLRIGKPSGTYRIKVMLYDYTGTQLLAQDSEDLLFLNPTQTLQIINPRVGLTYDVGNLLVEWTSLIGVDYYSIKANTRNNPNQSLEEALHSGTPLINEKNVRLTNSINLREWLEREITPGSEIVIQVTANISGPSGGNKLFSPIVNFNTLAPYTPETEMLKIRLRNILSRLPESFLLNLLDNNQIIISEIKTRSEDGTMMSIEELINFLESNPENILRIELE
jgi:hypothetical protein